MHQLPLTSWQVTPSDPDFVALLSRELGLNPIISSVLAAREIKDLDQAARFLSPSLKDIHNPFLMMGMRDAAFRVISGIHQQENILIYGDYDADGITSVAILYDFLKKMAVNVSYFIPDRINDGYGLRNSFIAKAKDQGIHLILTVDCGSSNHDEIRYAKSLGIDIIVLDHHEIAYPPAAAIATVNPKQQGCPFPFKHLAAVGITFNFLISLRAMLREGGYYSNREYPNLKNYLDIVALGTIADICPLTEDNRIFVKFGLDLLSTRQRAGLMALKETVPFDTNIINSSRASFFIIPRINAAGRLASASEAVELLLTEDIQEARNIARKLDGYNRQRQAMERAIMTQVEQRISAFDSQRSENSYVFASPDWHQGVIGIVASRLVDRYNRPVILISLKGGLGKGSGRSSHDFNMYEGLKSLNSYLLSYGGHRYAGGLTICENQIDSFTAEFNKLTAELATKEHPVWTKIDSNCRLQQLDDNLLRQVDLLAPFGVSNPEPVLCAQNIKISAVSVVGRNHLRMRLSEDHASYNSIWFGKGKYNYLSPDRRFDAVFSPQINHHNGSSEVQLKVHDLSLC